MPHKDIEAGRRYRAQWQRDNPEKNKQSNYRYLEKHPHDE